VDLVELLHKAQAAGFLKPAGMRGLLEADSSFSALRARKEFQQFLAQLPPLPLRNAPTPKL
jgi:hypothetical protein